jgi:hypothetical protein
MAEYLLFGLTDQPKKKPRLLTGAASQVAEDLRDQRAGAFTP